MQKKKSNIALSLDNRENHNYATLSLKGEASLSTKKT